MSDRGGVSDEAFESALADLIEHGTVWLDDRHTAIAVRDRAREHVSDPDRVTFLRDPDSGRYRLGIEQ